MRLRVGWVVVGILAGVLSIAPAYAQSRPAPEATQHALDELANCRQRPQSYPAGYCPTAEPTPVPTNTPRPAPTSTPVPVAPAAPVDDQPQVEPSPTPLPVLPAPDPGADAVVGYTRPVFGDGWIELALQQGRWAILQADDCARVDGWGDAWLTTDADGEVDLNSHTGDCGIVAATWQSDTPCAQTDDGWCDLNADASYLDWLGQQPTSTPVPTATPVPATARPAPPAPVSQPVRVAAPPALKPAEPAPPVAAPVPPAPVPTDSPTTAPSVAPSATPTLRVAPTATSTATATTTPTSTPIPAAAQSDPPSTSWWMGLHMDASRILPYGLALLALIIGGGLMLWRMAF